MHQGGPQGLDVEPVTHVHRHPHLPHGEQVAGLALATGIGAIRALAQQADIYFMDEPFAGVDAATEKAIINLLRTMKREHSRKPDEIYPIIEACSPGPYLELFARGPREKWSVWGNQSDEYYPTWETYANHSQKERKPQKERGKLRLVRG